VVRSDPVAPGSTDELRSRKRPADRIFKWVAALAGVSLVAFVVFVVVRGPSRPPGPSSAALAAKPPPLLVEGTAAPAFTLSALGGGAPVSLSSLRGKPVVLNFFASWCPDCRAELDAVAGEARAAHGKVAFAGIDSNESSEATATKLLAQAGAAYPVGLDADAKVASAYLVEALPVTYFLDAEGKVVGTADGPQSAQSLRTWVARLEAQQ
jgi:cytochrome c biogenesis protein CcmG, thiol:disulfide interchange protein DsbE